MVPLFRILQIEGFFCDDCYKIYIYINKVVIFVCLFVCPIITHFTPGPNFDWGTRVNHGNVLSFVFRF